jgi:predicted TIM-barrel fold metal-dependent hydrolase
MDEATLAAIPLVDVDSHVLEPPDLWTSRLGKRLAEYIPRVVTDPSTKAERWMIGDQLMPGVAKYASAGWVEPPPGHPPTLAQADPAAWNPTERLKRLDEFGIDVQVLYLNLLAFHMRSFKRIPDPDLVLDCVRAGNDFLTDFVSEDPRRFVPLMILPFWDLEASLAEVERCVKMGHKGIVFASKTEDHGLPPLASGHWDRLFHLAEDNGLSINFHVGIAQLEEEEHLARMTETAANRARNTSVGMLNNSWAVAEMITSGLCHRFPNLKFVSVESGASWLPYLVEALDWHWLNFGAKTDNPHMEMPSFYFYRQIFGSYWFEAEAAENVLTMLQNNLMFETDFPHPTSLSPGPASSADRPRATAERSVRNLSEEVARKVLCDNARRVYHLPELSRIAVAV